MNFRLTLFSLFFPSLHPSMQGVVPVRHQLPGCKTQQPRRVGDQTGNGTGKQFIGGDVSEKGLLHSREVGSLFLLYLRVPKIKAIRPLIVCILAMWILSCFHNDSFCNKEQMKPQVCSTHTPGRLTCCSRMHWPMHHAKFAIHLVIALSLYGWLSYLCVWV